jgi:seryl-tRNA synthetase
MALTSVPELERHAAVLVDRLEAHTRYISYGQRRLTDAGQLQEEMQRLAQQVASATDEQARKQFALALEARKAQLGELEELKQSRERLLANLARVVATLESLPSKMLKMRTLDDTNMDSVSGDFGQEIDRINDELRAFEETLRPVEERVR